ncbi:Conserved oligomeric Golgi complex subunit 6 [Brachionus plicatilis]|uniref:Conserved oligomeric Golgi complex subunit 6 n=1 Tax=Brachionus plicatilis TaxID=10195 RepID=A0A3M7S975_BRAPC|nr:Conserved oligomeric Golgi complex subunit 6 [Brachionus plicatilis]
MEESEKHQAPQVQSAPSHLSKKLNKILESRIENDKELLEAMKTLSGFVKENSIRSRKNLRSDIEKRSLSLNEEFLETFRNVKEQLDEISGIIGSMSDCSDNMLSRLNQVKLQTNELISKTNQLQNQKKNVETKLKLAEKFIQKFQLDADEVNYLVAKKDGNLHPDFFRSLEKVRTIHENCKILLRTNQQTAGLEIMEQMAINQETAYERLYRWMQNECRLLCNDTVEINDFMSTAFFTLTQRPILYNYILDEYCNSRRNAIVKLFIDALTKGGPSGTPRPIELNSHDPMRYMGDMLAWIHQTTASENEFLRSLFRKFKENSDLESTIKKSLGTILDGVCRALRVRIEQVLVSQHDTTLYKISNLIKFFDFTIRQKINESCELVQTLSDIYQLSYKMFLNSLNIHATRLLEKVEPPNNELLPNEEFRQTLSLIKEIFDSYSNSVVSVNTKKDDYIQILDCVIEPMLQMASLSAINLPVIDMAVYMINCIYSIHSMLSLYEYTDPKLEKLEAQIEAHLDTLSNEQGYFILSKTDLLDAYKIIQGHDKKTRGPLVNVLGMDSNTLKSSMNKFDVYLAAPDSLIVPQFNLLLSSNIRTKLKQKSIRLVCDAYRLIFNSITDTENGYSNSSSIVPRNPDQILELLL